MRTKIFRICSLLSRKPAMLTDSLAGRLTEIYQKLAIGRVHLELSLGSRYFRLFSGKSDSTTAGQRHAYGRIRSASAPTRQSKENDHDEI